MRSKLKIGILIGISVFWIFCSGAVRASVSNSLMLCAKILIPSLFPFIVVSGMLGDMGPEHWLGGTNAAMLTGLICGFPLGTRATAKYYQNGSLTKTQANRLLLCTANASPAFLVLAVGRGILQNAAIGIKLLLIQSAGSLLLFICFVPKSRPITKIGVSVSLIDSLIQNLKTATEQMMLICGTTVFFGIFYDLFRMLPMALPVKNILSGIIELTHGCIEFSSETLLPLGMVIGLSGICVWTQCCYYIRQSHLSASFLIIGKIWQAIWLPLGIILPVHIVIAIILLICIIIILTNAIPVCIIDKRGCERYDFFKRN